MTVNQNTVRFSGSSPFIKLFESVHFLKKEAAQKFEITSAFAQSLIETIRAYATANRATVQ